MLPADIVHSLVDHSRNGNYRWLNAVLEFHHVGDGHSHARCDRIVVTPFGGPSATFGAVSMERIRFPTGHSRSYGLGTFPTMKCG